jgi:hypothetical protein
MGNAHDRGYHPLSELRLKETHTWLGGHGRVAVGCPGKLKLHDFLVQ